MVCKIKEMQYYYFFVNEEYKNCSKSCTFIDKFFGSRLKVENVFN